MERIQHGDPRCLHRCGHNAPVPKLLADSLPDGWLGAKRERHETHRRLDNKLGVGKDGVFWVDKVLQVLRRVQRGVLRLVDLETSLHVVGKLFRTDGKRVKGRLKPALGRELEEPPFLDALYPTLRELCLVLDRGTNRHGSLELGLDVVQSIQSHRISQRVDASKCRGAFEVSVCRLGRHFVIDVLPLAFALAHARKLECQPIDGVQNIPATHLTSLCAKLSSHALGRLILGPQAQKLPQLTLPVHRNVRNLLVVPESVHKHIFDATLQILLRTGVLEPRL